MQVCWHCMEHMQEGQAFCPACGGATRIQAPAYHLLPGSVLNGRYLVGKSLGEGGFGITYIGRDLRLDMPVAIKEYFPNGYVYRGADSDSEVHTSETQERQSFFRQGKERFLREARALARFAGESGIVEVRDFFEENNTAYIVMEYLKGQTLKAYLKEHGVLTPRQTLEMLLPVMQSLQKVHETGLIHRDISPDNIMLVGDKVKLLDFGAARDVSAAEGRSLSVMLKPGYAPEEQYRSKGNQGPWTDVYALCATMYKCMTGITPDDSTQRVFSDDVKAPSAMGIAIPPVIERALMKGLAVRQGDRYQSIPELLDGLQGKGEAMEEEQHTVYAAPAGAEPSRVPEMEEDCCTIAEPPAVQEEPRPMEQAPHAHETQAAQPPQQTAFYQAEEDGFVPTQLLETPKKKKKTGVIFAIAAGVLAILVSIVLLAGNPGTVAGERVSKRDTYVSISDAEITVKDIQVLSRLPHLQSLYFYRCTISQEAYEAFDDYSWKALYKISLEECSGTLGIYTFGELPQLSHLEMNYCGITDAVIGGVLWGKLTALQELSLVGNPELTDLSPLAELGGRLEILDLTGTSVSDISALAAQGSLEEVNLSNTQVTDLGAFAGMTELRRLYLSGTGVTNLEALADCAELEELDITDCQVSSLAPLSACLELECLRAANNQLASLSGLENAAELRILNVNGNQLTNLAGLENALYLQYLYASENQIADLAGLTNATVLQEVYLNHNLLTDIAILAKSAATLEELCFDGNQVTDLTPLAGTAALEVLSFRDNAVSDLTPLGASTQLEQLYGDGNAITSLNGLQACGELSTISLPDNQITDCSALGEIAFAAEHGIKTLDLSGNQIAELVLPQLSGDGNVGFLAIYNNPIANIESAIPSSLLHEYRTTLALSYIPGADFTFLQDTCVKYIVVDCPLDQQVAMDDALGSNVYFLTAEEAAAAVEEHNMQF